MSRREMTASKKGGEMKEYINRKTGELVTALFRNNLWYITRGDEDELVIKEYFYEQYGKAMICTEKDCSVTFCYEPVSPDTPCPHRLPHICEGKLLEEKNSLMFGMGCPACIPHMPEQEEN